MNRKGWFRIGRRHAAIGLFVTLVAGGYELPDLRGFFEQVKQALPAYSALPPISDLSTALARSSQVNGAWEQKYENMEGFIRRDITDTGSDAPAALAETHKEEVGAVALPARTCQVVLIGKAGAGHSYLASKKHFVYSLYEMWVEQVLKPTGHRLAKKDSTVDVILFGGGLRFPSGQIQLFVIHGSGFFEEGKTYLLFLWKDSRKMPAYDVGAAYLLDGGVVHSIVEAQFDKFNGMPIDVFKAAVASAISKNVDR